jgi:hypothetical protein
VRTRTADPPTANGPTSFAEACTQRILGLRRGYGRVCTPRASRRSSLSEEPRLPLLLRDRRPCGRVPRLVLLVKPAVDECPDQGAGRDAASEALAAQPRVDAFFETHRNRLPQGSHLRPQAYTSQPPPATERSVPAR